MADLNNIFKMNKIPITHISQNHLDALNSVISSFCRLNKSYRWYLIANNNRKIEASKISAYLSKTEPRSIHYVVESESTSSELLVSIDNGITVNLKNGSYELYGLYGLTNDTLDNIKVPVGVVFLRRYWLLNSFFAGWFIPILMFLIFNSNGWALSWLLFYPVVLFVFTLPLADSDFIDNLEWEDVVLPTKIQYGKYNIKAGTPIVSLLSSTKALISVAASLATILSFVFYLAQR